MNLTTDRKRGISSAPFGSLPDGTEIALYTIMNANGVAVSVCEYGARIISILVPDHNRQPVELILRYEDLQGYLHDPNCFGATIGRYANRIAGGRFELEGVTYQLATNNGPNHLHGGTRGFDKVLWRGNSPAGPSHPQLQMERVSPDGEEGYPGNLTTSVTYELDDENQLTVEMVATTDAPTIVSLSQHPYFNLAGPESRNILDHELQLHADTFLPTDETGIPTGELRPVVNTPMDFRDLRRIGDRIDADDEQIRIGAGYDHCWVLRGPENELKPAALLLDPRSGRSLEVSCSTPGMQFYSGNHLQKTAFSGGSRPIGYRLGLPLEPQQFPDSPNKSHFPSTVLHPGETYRHTITYRFLGIG
ncbi:aldose epimerase family protein [Candidatus Neomarinimicrobiota bacterium]